jgi:chromosome segregation ATPase
MPTPKADSADSQYRGEPRLTDPTVLTTQALRQGLEDLEKLFETKLEVLRERLHGIDRATELLNAQVTRVPTDVDKQVGHLSSLMGEKFDGVAKQFEERDKRGERESRDNKVAVDAAFAAQKEAAAKQDQANSKAIDKSESTTTETIRTNADAAKAEARALSDKIDDLKDRVGLIEGRTVGIVNAGAERSTGNTYVLGLIGAAVGIIGVVGMIVMAFVKH